MVPVIVNTSPGEEFQLSRRFWQGCPTILRTPKGRLYAGWYSGGTGEPAPDNYNLLIKSDDEGWSWSTPVAVVASDMKNEYIAIDIQLWLDPFNRMWMFITQRYLGEKWKITDTSHLALWAAVCEDPDAENPVWGKPQYITNGFLRTQPTVLSNGDWLLCAYNWCHDHYQYCRSSDQGRTWRNCLAGKKLSPDFDETMILERKDGTLLMLARDIKRQLVKTESTDLAGTNWSDGIFTGLPNASSRFFLRRLKSGRVLLIHNEAHDFRRNLVAKLSEDEGASWSCALQLDDAETPERSISYPDAVESEDGRIFIIYDRGRNTFREILMAQITEEDIINGTLCRHDSYLRRIISKAPCPADQKEYEALKQRDEKWKEEFFWKTCRL
ncbi:MAG: exo-alpha-sialidase [Lentisphaeria bacterium]|nr:exo-alpha-sialidase [Lentisphaeria bacterium]